MANCKICDISYTNVIRKKIICPKCGFDACTTCVRNYLLTGSLYDCCMNCKQILNYEFLATNFPKTFIRKDLKDNRANLLLLHEKSFLPALVIEKEIRDERNNRFNELKKKCVGLISKVAEELTEAELKKLEESASKALDRIEKVEVVKQKREKFFLMKCPFDDCNGFIARTKCGSCNRSICPDCHIEVKEDDEHKCNPNEVESVKMIKENYRSCPKCKTLIEKKSGCDQMFCTQCHTGFDWKTGKEINLHRIHNPEYFAWLANRGGDVAMNIGCFGDLREKMLRKFKGTPWRDSLVKIFTLIAEMDHNFHAPSHYGGRTYPAPPTQEEEDQNKLELRVRYLDNKLSDREWTKQLYASKFYKDCAQEYQQLQSTLNLTIKSLVQEFSEKDNSKIDELFIQLNEVIKLFNSLMEKHFILYGSEMFNWRCNPETLQWSR